jgi:[ribosomal protein S5]-alanine N-acetyltransferase
MTPAILLTARLKLYQTPDAQSPFPHEQSGYQDTFTVTLASTQQVIGELYLCIDLEHNHARFGGEIALPYQHNGYGTEASQSLIDYGFLSLGLHRIYAQPLSHELATCHVLQAVGMIHEGRLKQHVHQAGRYIDLELFGLLAHDYAQQVRRPAKLIHLGR